MKNEIIKLAQEKCKEYLKEKSITYHPSYVWLCQYIAEQVYEQMLKDAVGGMVCATITNQVAISFFSPLPKELKAGDKVRIVVLKAEEK